MATLTAAIDALLGKQRQLATQAEDTRLNDLSKQVGDLVSAAMPAAKEIDELAAATKLLNQAMETPALAGYLAHADNLTVDKRFAEAQRTAIDPIDKATRALQLHAAAIDHRSLADKVAQAVQQKTLEFDGQKIAADKKQRQLDLVAQIAGGGQTARDQQTIARINALGELATVTDKMRAKQLELNNANREGLGISTESQAALVRLVERKKSRRAPRRRARPASPTRPTLAARSRSSVARLSIAGCSTRATRPRCAANTVLAKSFEQMSAAAETRARRSRA